MRRIIGGIIGVGVVIGLGGSCFGCRSAAIAATARTGGLRSGGAADLQLGRFYIGVNGDWGWGTAKYTANAFAGFPDPTGSLSDNGGVVGGTLPEESAHLKSRPQRKVPSAG